MWFYIGDKKVILQQNSPEIREIEREGSNKRKFLFK